MIDLGPIIAATLATAGSAFTFRRGDELTIPVQAAEGKIGASATPDGDQELLIVGQERVVFIDARELMDGDGNHVTPQPGDTLEREHPLTGALVVWEVIPDPRELEDQPAEPLGTLLQVTVRRKS